MAKTAKKQTSKQKTQKAATAARKSESIKKTKKPASFSKNAATVKKEADFAEFETMKLDMSKKAASKVILRDVAKEKPLAQTPKKEKKTQVKTHVTAPKPVRTIPKKQTSKSKPTAKEIKEQEIAKAISNAAKLPVTNVRRRKRTIFGDFGLKRVVLATICVTTAIFAVVYFINLTSMDMSLKVAAMQSGINASYPSYVPRGYALSDVTSGSGRVSMHFRNGEDEFGLTEENSSWDSEALLNNYIKPNYEDDYTVVREQGLTLYMGWNWEAWVNGGILYKLSVNSGELTKKQMKSIATSL